MKREGVKEGGNESSRVSERSVVRWALERPKPSPTLLSFLPSLAPTHSLGLTLVGVVL